MSNAFLPQASSGTWAIVGPVDQLIQMKNVFWLFGNQSIPYVHLYHYQVVNYDSIRQYAGLIIWTSAGYQYNSTAVKLFAESKPVISDVFDFCNNLYPALSGSIVAISTYTVTYLADWGNFRIGDLPEMHNGTYYLKTVTATSLTAFPNITKIAGKGTNNIAIFHMKGSSAESGFYVMDLYATRDNSYGAGNYHLFPVIATAATIKVGRYSRWLTYGLDWQTLDSINDWMSNFNSTNKDIVKLRKIGTSVQGRSINSLFIGKGTRYFMVDAAIHGLEKGGTTAIIRFAELLVEWYRTDQNWRDKLTQYTVILVPVLNPDGYVANTRDNANGVDLNRQFSPTSTTTEPEAWALRWLMGNYTPTQYASLHTGGEIYPLNAFYISSSYPYDTYPSLAVNEGNLLFQDLKHWGTMYGVSVGAYKRITRISTGGSTSYAYAFSQHKSVALTMEWWGVPKHNLYAQEFYMSALLTLILHHDKPEGSMVHSNAFITKTTEHNGSALTVYLNKTYIAANRTSETKIYDSSNSGTPKQLYIDGIQKLEGQGWSWNSSTRTTTVNGANESVLLEWEVSRLWDVNSDGKVNMIDIVFVVSALYTTLESPNWEPRADLNSNAKIDLKDIAIVAKHFGEEYT